MFFVLAMFNADYESEEVVEWTRGKRLVVHYSLCSALYMMVDAFTLFSRHTLSTGGSPLVKSSPIIFNAAFEGKEVV